MAPHNYSFGKYTHPNILYGNKFIMSTKINIKEKMIIKNFEIHVIKSNKHQGEQHLRINEIIPMKQG